MRKYKNNIALNLENIISFFGNITNHFTGRAKIITLAFIIIILSSINIIWYSSGVFYNTNVSALDYSSNVGIGFTFNPTLSVSLSSSDLIIDNLKPGTTEDSNSINVSVATNAAYGYILSANVGDDIHNNSNLTHTNNTSVFSSIATNADLASLDTDNTWGYTSKLSNETVWSNYSGLSNSSNAILLDNNNTADSTGSVDFKIAAKASNTQPSGEYTGTINFTAVSNVAPMSLLDSFIASGAEQLNGYFKMQDMTHDICNNVDIEESELQLIDVRDNKVYWVAKLKDGNCWMTQNLDLDLSHNRMLTSGNTDLNDHTSVAYRNGYTVEGSVIKWEPISGTIKFVDYKVDNWDKSSVIPYSASKIDDTAVGHDSLGNYYNWTAAIASNDSSSFTSATINNIDNNPKNSVCSRGWRLPTVSNQSGALLSSTNEFARLDFLYKTDIGQDNLWIISSPLYFVKSGRIPINGNSLAGVNVSGYYWSSTIFGDKYAYYFDFSDSYINTAHGNDKDYGLSVRCVAR